ncbi:Uncharacterized protein ChrSV_1043 [Chromobacterium vaccinii]|nr:Uncharacterized protein ChrSW_1043 [Chromobacterium vaccinii]QND88501.1 Uncharacterized protein ChrSV_1043 [Chromobacterium vaccinii]
MPPPPLRDEEELPRPRDGLGEFFRSRLAIHHYRYVCRTATMPSVFN